MSSKLNTDILILGGGIAGLETFHELKKRFKKNNINKEITIIDKNNYFTFTPLLHEIATGAVDPTHATLPLREVTYKSRHKFRQAEVEQIHPEEKTVDTSIGEISYERCVAALGSTINFCGVEGAKKFTHHVRTLKDALQLRNNVIKKLEDEPDELQINVVGGGYTGVELAAEFGQLKQDDFKKLYPQTDVEINIIDVNDNILSRMSEKVQNRVTERLKNLGINIIPKTSATKVTEDEVKLSNNETLANDITVWAAGFTTNASNLIDQKYLEKDRLPVNNHLQHRKEDTLYALGDIALVTGPKNEEVYPQLGEASHMEGIYAGRQVVADLQDKGKERDPFEFSSKGRLMPVGEWYGVAVFPWLNDFTLFGRLAWWMRRTAYLMFMPGIMKKLRIMCDWTIQAFSFRNLTEIAPRDYKKN